VIALLSSGGIALKPLLLRRLCSGLFGHYSKPSTPQCLYPSMHKPSTGFFWGGEVGVFFVSPLTLAWRLATPKPSGEVGLALCRKGLCRGSRPHGKCLGLKPRTEYKGLWVKQSSIAVKKSLNFCISSLSLGKLRRSKALFMVEPLLSGIVLGLVPVTIAGLFVTAYLQYRRGDLASF